MTSSSVNFGVSLERGGATVTMPSRLATRIDLCLFDSTGNREEKHLPLVKKGDIHAAFIPGLKEGDRYGLRAHGPWDPHEGHRFDASKLLVDPWATALDRPFSFHPGLCEHFRDTAEWVPKAIVTAKATPVSRKRPHKPTWIYELPVKAFTMRHPDVPPEMRGTMAALRHPSVLNHFKKMAVDTIELMPLMAWIDERHLHALDLSNAWGYNPVTFFAPDPRLAPGGFAEIAETIRCLHEIGIQVLLDVVLNHTGESDAAGPTLSFRGFDNTVWYRHINGAPVNDTGCGNTVALDDPLVADYAIAALRHWVTATGLDGFRFDLATIMGRNGDGFRKDAPFIKAIMADDVLADCILIAEPWDVGPGGYQLGNFPPSWHEWNDKYRDDVRRFWRGDAFSANALATRLAGSSNVFAGRSPAASINFISAHDGFTLADLTRFAEKRNMANGEGNRDGKNGEVTWLGGDVRALLATLFLSRGTPMLTAGDEFGRSQQGNNNAYAQDNDTTWLQWREADLDLASFTAALVRLRPTLPLLAEDKFLTGKPVAKGIADATWFDINGKTPDWQNPDNRFLGLMLFDGKTRLALAVNGSATDLVLPVSAEPKMTWERLFTSAHGPGCPAQSVSLFRAKSA